MNEELSPDYPTGQQEVIDVQDPNAPSRTRTAQPPSPTPVVQAPVAAQLPIQQPAQPAQLQGVPATTAPPIPQKVQGNYTCTICQKGPFEGPRALANHESRIHSRGTKTGNERFLPDPDTPPATAYQDQHIPASQYILPEEYVPADQIRMEPPMHPIDLRPESDLALKVDQKLAWLGYNQKDWIMRRKLLIETLNTVQGYDNPVALEGLLQSMGVRPDHLRIISVNVFGSRTAWSAPGGIPHPGMGYPSQQGPQPYGYPQGYGYAQQPIQQPPPPPVDPMKRIQEAVEIVSSLQQAFGGGQSQGPSPEDRFAAMLGAFKAGREDGNGGGKGDEVKAAMARYDLLMDKLLARTLTQPQVQAQPDGGIAATIGMMKDLGVLQRPASLQETITQIKTLSEATSLGNGPSIEIAKINAERENKKDELGLQRERLINEQRLIEQRKADEKAHMEMLSKLGEKAIEKIGGPLMEAMGEGAKQAVFNGQGGGGGQQRTPAQALAALPPHERLDRIRKAKAQMDSLEAEAQQQVQQTQAQQPSGSVMG